VIVGAQSLLSVGLGSELSAFLHFDYVEVRAGIDVVWLPAATPLRGMPGTKGTHGTEGTPGTEGTLDASRAVRERLELVMVGRSVSLSAQTSHLRMEGGASVLACALFRLGLQQLELDGDLAVKARSLGGGWADDVSRAFNELADLYLRGFSGEAVSGSVLPQLVRSALLSTERCASARPCAAPPEAAEGGGQDGAEEAEAAPPLGSWMQGFGMGRIFGWVVRGAVAAAGVSGVPPIVLSSTDGSVCRLEPSGALRDGASWTLEEGSTARFSLLPNNASALALVLTAVAMETRLGEARLEAGREDTLLFALDRAEASATVQLELPRPGPRSGDPRAEPNASASITTSARLRLRDVRAAVPVRFKGASRTRAARPWMFSLSELIGGAACVHVRATGKPTFSATVEALVVREGSAAEDVALEEPIPLELLPAWRPWLADTINEAAKAAEATAGSCPDASFPADLLMATPLWAVVVLLLLTGGAAAAACALRLRRALCTRPPPREGFVRMLDE